MVTADWVSRILPRTLNGFMMWTISFLMLFLLIRRFDQAKRKNERFWAKETFVETFVNLFVLVLAIITFIYYVFIGGSLIVVSNPLPVPPIPATVYSIVLSLIAFGTFLFTLLRYLNNSERKYPSPNSFLLSFLIIILFFGMRYALLVLTPPWGDPIRSVINLIIDVSVFGLLFPYIFAAIILYMIRALKEG
jgi:hypothetical protein